MEKVPASEKMEVDTSVTPTIEETPSEKAKPEQEKESEPLRKPTEEQRELKPESAEAMQQGA